MDIQLEHLSLNELQVLRTTVDQEIQKRQAQVRQEGLEKIKQLATEYGLSVDELKALGNTNKTTAKRSPVPPKYRDPNNPSNTWTGRGRKPKWVEAYLAANGSLEDIAI
jgi:DNA-binding protein H-NS